MTRDWASYKYSLARRGEILLDLSLLKNTGTLLETAKKVEDINRQLEKQE
jgi:hypothetical protein